MHVYVGTSGWSYAHWRGPFYPPPLTASAWLGYYARHFDSVEVNRSFYRLPTRETFAGWREETPAGFLFSVKASRFLSHMKKLTEPQRTLSPLLQAMAGLGEKQGPLLVQLPPRWRSDPGRLAGFLEAVPPGLRVAFELRDPSWHQAPVLQLLERFNSAFCVFELGGFRSPRIVTADFAYVRLHGPGAPYRGCYDAGALAEWARWLAVLPVDRAYVYFDNDEAGFAVRNALEFRTRLLGVGS